MISGFLFRPKPLGIQMGGSASTTDATMFPLLGGEAVDQPPILWPGVWEVMLVGGGGGGGGYDSFYGTVGERGGGGTHMSLTTTINSSPTTQIGRGGQPGMSSSSGGGAGTAGGTSFFISNYSTFQQQSAPGGAAGRGGYSTSGWGRVPLPSGWPYGTAERRAGMGGYGRNGSYQDNTLDVHGIEGSIRMTLKG